jgi:hypothetical protein
VDAARDELAAAGCSVLVVTQARPEFVSRYQTKSNWHVPIVADPGRAAYKAFGLERTGLLTFFRPGVVLGYLLGMLRGYAPKMPYKGEDVMQLGGDFVIDRSRRVIFAYPSATPTDRPRVRAIRAALRPPADIPAN